MYMATEVSKSYNAGLRMQVYQSMKWQSDSFTVLVYVYRSSIIILNHIRQLLSALKL